MGIFNEVLQSRAEQERNMTFRHPWFNLMYNWLIGCLIVILAILLICWAVDIRTEHIANERAATAMAEYQAELKAAEEARAEELAAAKASAENIMKSEATEIAKMFYGIRLFIDKYHYSERDLETYARCVFNRVDFGNGVNSVEAIVSQKDQFTGYDSRNQVLDEYYQLAYKFVSNWHSEETKPCDLGYRWAELTPQGIFLINEYGADGYARRWQA